MSQIVLYDNRDSTNANKVRFLLAERCRPPAATGDRCSPVPAVAGTASWGPHEPGRECGQMDGRAQVAVSIPLRRFLRRRLGCRLVALKCHLMRGLEDLDGDDEPVA
jgi:hypothetical protein